MSITHREYVQDSERLHQDFYQQLVTEDTLHYVCTRIGVQRLLKSEDPHFNDIIPSSGRGSWLWDHTPIDLQKARELGEVGINSSPSLSTRTCVGKAAAQMLLDEYKKENCDGL